MGGPVKALFGGAATPAMPKLPKPQPMPTLDDPTRLAQLRAQTIARSKRGRRGTIFSGGESGGGTSIPSYSNQTLGGAA